MFEGMLKAFEQPPIWVALVTGILGAIGARKARERVTVWARERYNGGSHTELRRALDGASEAVKSLERAFREEAQKTRDLILNESKETRKSVHDEGDKTQDLLTQVDKEIALLRGKER